jgi:hypothetical protein
MSVQRANCSLMRCAMTGSAFSMPPSVSSLNTTPKPKVSSAALRSHTVMSCAGFSCFMSAAK